MPRGKIVSRLRQERRSCGLTQPELARLVGHQCGTYISKFETQCQKPTIQLIMACRVLFGLNPEEICPTLYERVEGQVMRRVYALYRRLADNRTPIGLKKKNFLKLVLKRATNRSK